jgi:hypothetical protein
MTKLYDIAGVSRVRAGYALKFRVANGKPARRARTLERAGCVDIQLFQIEPMSKEQAYAWFCKEHTELAAEVKGKIGKSECRDLLAKEVPAKAKTIEVGRGTFMYVDEFERMQAAAKRKSKSKAKPAVEVLPENVEVVDAALSPAAKLALKRAKDAARKREKRAAEKAAKLAAVA